MDQPTVIDSKELQGLTGTKASTWRYWDSTGTGPADFPASFKIGRRRVWNRSAVLAWLAEQQVTSA
jgi:prophage regulatory protein